MAKRRFSKISLGEDLQRQKAQLEADFGFDESNGWQQVANEDTTVKIAYGRYEHVCDMLDDIL